MTFIIPNQQSKNIRQLNTGEIAGEIFSSKNIDLSEQGLIKLSHATIANMTTDNDAAFDSADSMFKSKNNIYVLSSELYNNDGNIGTPTVGMDFGGGKVAYILQDGDTGYEAGKIKGLVIDPTPLSAGVIWHTTNDGDVTTSTDLGTGQANTTAILALYGTEDNAAELCSLYEDGVFTDWYLPSLDELKKVHDNVAYLGLGTTGVVANTIWTSSQKSTSLAYGYRIISGSTYESSKNNEYGVYAMRSFSVTIKNGILDLNPLTSRTEAGDTDAPTPNTQNDGVFFNNTDVVLDSGDLLVRVDNVWVDIGLELDTDYPSCIEVFDTFNSVLIGNKNNVIMVDTDYVTVKTLVMPSQYTVTSIAVLNNTVFIGTKHNAGGEAKLFIWDGTSTAYNSNYGVGTFEIFTVKKYNGSCALVTSAGELLQFSGGGFAKLGQLPPKYLGKDYGDANNVYAKISNRGMVVDLETIYIRLDSDLDGNNPYNNYFVGGLWCYTPETGLYCIHTPTYSTVLKKTIATTAVNIGTDTITTTEVPITGTPVIYTDGGSTAITGLTDNKLYYTIKVSSTEFKLATSLANAIAETAIDLTGTGNNAQAFYFILVNDYGFSYAGNKGAVEVLPMTISSNDLLTERVVFTADLFAKQNVGTKKTVFNVTNPQLANRGYFITPKLNSSNLEDIYNTISIKYRPLKEEDSIIIKYKTVNNTNLPFNSFSDAGTYTGTWTDTNTFTTTLDMTNASVGDEIEIIGGVGAGFLSHIESLTENAGTWTVNLTDSFIFAVNGDLMYFAVDNFAILDTITASENTGQEYNITSLDKNSKFLQLKIELRGVDTTIEELQVSNQQFNNPR